MAAPRSAIYGIFDHRPTPTVKSPPAEPSDADRLPPARGASRRGQVAEASGEGEEYPVDSEMNAETGETLAEPHLSAPPTPKPALPPNHSTQDFLPPASPGAMGIRDSRFVRAPLSPSGRGGDAELDAALRGLDDWARRDLGTPPGPGGRGSCRCR